MSPSCSAAQHLHHDVDLTLRLQDFMILSCVVHCVSKALHVEESQSAAKERQSYLSLYLLRSSVATLEPELYLHVDGRCNLDVMHCLTCQRTADLRSSTIVNTMQLPVCCKCSEISQSPHQVATIQICTGIY